MSRPCGLVSSPGSPFQLVAHGKAVEFLPGCTEDTTPLTKLQRSTAHRWSVQKSPAMVPGYKGLVSGLFEGRRNLGLPLQPELSRNNWPVLW